MVGARNGWWWIEEERSWNDNELSCKRGVASTVEGISNIIMKTGDLT